MPDSSDDESNDVLRKERHMRTYARKTLKERGSIPVSSREPGKTAAATAGIVTQGSMNDTIEKSPRLVVQRHLVAQLQDVRQRKASKVFAKNIVGTYTDGGGVVHQINVAGPYQIAEYKSHPKGHVDYNSKVKAALKQNGDVPDNIPDSDITITDYQQYGKEA